MELFEHERMLLESDDKTVVLTDLRVRVHFREWGRTRLTSMLLSQVASCELTARSYPLLLAAAAIAALLGATTGHDNLSTGLVAAAVLAVAYLLTRRQVVAIRSTGGAELVYAVQSRNTQISEEFINAVERAKVRLAQSPKNGEAA